MNHNWDADRLLTRYFDTPIRFYLLRGRILDLTNIRTNYTRVRGFDIEGKRHRLHKNNILFAVPVEKMPDVQPHIKMHSSMGNLKIDQENLIANRFHIEEHELESTVGDHVVLVTRGGHVIHGELQAFDKYHLFMRVGNKVVLVYRHGLFNFNKETVPSLTETNALRELRKKRPQEWVKASRLKKETVLRTEGNDRNEVRKKEHPERVETNQSKKEKVPNLTKNNDLRKLEKNEKVPETTLKKRKFRQEDEHIPSDYKAITAHNEKRLGTDTASRKTQVSMYSDSTHFVYEILQNADDHGATEVCFKLSENEIVIEHNGESFTKENVEAITYFGKSTSRNDLVKTGRFGVGFKSVFAFTATPIIISGNEHFQIYGLYRIKEHPYPNDFSRSRTRIILSFNHESEQPDFVEKLMLRQEAYTQISQCLTTLNMKTLLFTRNIKEIHWKINDRSACYRREDEIDNNVRFTTITNGKHENKYVVFSKVPKWENEAHKAVEIAFAADAQGRLAPIDNDSLYVLFRTEETTGLKFILNGPYRTNPARETISKIDDFNLHLMKLTCELMKESLPYLRDGNLLTVEFLSVLPNEEDTLPDFYIPLRDTIISEFRNEKLTPTKRGAYEAASRLYRDRSGRGLSDLIQDMDLATLLGQDTTLPLWVANAPQLVQKRDERGQFVQDTNARRRNKRIGDFLSMLDITEWTTEEFIEVLRARDNTIIGWLQVKPDDWHQRLYALLGDFLSSTFPYSYQTRERKNKLLLLNIVRCKDGNYRTGGQCHFPIGDAEFNADLLRVTTGIEAENTPSTEEDDEHIEDFHYVAKGIHTSGQNRDQQEKARKFLETIGVREVDETERIKMILKQRYMSESFNPHEGDLERFIKLVEVDPSKANLFTSYPIFQIDKDLDNKNWWASPQQIFLDSPYLDTGLTAYYEAIEEKSNHFRRALSPKYAKSGIDPKRLGKFAEAVGTQTKLQISKHEISSDHPEWDWLMSAPGTWVTDTGTNEDYSIHEFEALFYEPLIDKAKSIDRAKLIWRTMSCVSEFYLRARFRRNQSNESREAHSSLVHNLKDTTWVPQKNGDSISFVLPREASIERLLEGFPYESEQEWLQAIEFGEIAREQKAQYSRQNWFARELGFSSGVEAETMVEITNLLKEQGRSPDELLREFGIPKRRTERLTIELSDAEEKQYEIRARSIRSTRNTIDPHTFLREQYTKFNNMECQMCRQEMPFKKRNSDDDYFEAVEAFGKDYFPKEHGAQHLALCPECAAKYQEYVKKDRVARKSLYNLLKDLDEPEVRLELRDFAIHICFNEKHWHDLKTVLHYYENVYEAENSTD